MKKPKDNCISPRILVHIPIAGKQSNTRALQRYYGSKCVFVQVVAAFTMKVNLTFTEIKCCWAEVATVVSLSMSQLINAGMIIKQELY